MSSRKVQAGVEVTPEMIQQGLTWLYAFDKDYPERGPGLVRRIMEVALAIAEHGRAKVKQAI